MMGNELKIMRKCQDKGVPEHLVKITQSEHVPKMLHLTHSLLRIPLAKLKSKSNGDAIHGM